MTRTLRSALATALVLAAVVLAPTLLAQTALFTTTLGAALAAPLQGSPAQAVTLASGTSVAVGQGMVVGGEYMTVQASTPVATRWTVARGQGGTVASAHASGDPVFFGASNNFAFNTQQPSGPCVSTAQQATPLIVVSLSTSIYLCPPVNTLASSTASTWGQITSNGLSVANPTRYTGWTYVTLGALTVQPGVQFIGSAGALAMTLAAPSKYMDGMVMTLIASTAQAHTVTYTAGFYGTTTSSDIATFGGAIGDAMTIYATNGAWRILTMKGVTVA